MNDVDERLRAELDEAIPAVPLELKDWDGVLSRAGEPARRRRRRRVSGIVLAGAALTMLAVTPLGGAIARGVGGFSDWLTGTPGAPVSPETQRRFEAAADRKSTRLNSSHWITSRMPSSA